MSRSVQEALKRAAQKDRRSVASLLDKIITDFLELEGFSIRESHDVERRKYPRRKITLPGTTRLHNGGQPRAFPSVILDVSMTGALVTYPKGSEINFASVGDLPQFELCFDLPRTGEQVCLNCKARRMADMGNEIQVGATFNETKESELQKLQAYLV
jgi:hypothetical protein